jgi:hypothetical protein
MKRLSIMTPVLLSFFLTGCATLIKGYYDEVPVLNYHEGMTITNHYGERIVVHDKIRTNAVANPYAAAQKNVDTLIVGKIIMLATSENHVLKINDGVKEKTVTARRQVGLGWLFLDTVLGVYPMIVDAYTGCWHKFEHIDLAVQ